MIEIMRPARQHATDAVAEGLLVPQARLEGAVEVDLPPERRNDRGWPVAVLAARIEGHDFDGQIGVWAVGGDDAPASGVGPIFAIDSVAREWSSWGSAAQPGSPMMEIIERLAGYQETRDARDAVKNGTIA